jgi:hypothetical protein
VGVTSARDVVRFPALYYEEGGIDALSMGWSWRTRTDEYAHSWMYLKRVSGGSSHVDGVNHDTKNRRRPAERLPTHMDCQTTHLRSSSISLRSDCASPPNQKPAVSCSRHAAARLTWYILILSTTMEDVGPQAIINARVFSFEELN